MIIRGIALSRLGETDIIFYTEELGTNNEFIGQSVSRITFSKEECNAIKLGEVFEISVTRINEKAKS